MQIRNVPFCTFYGQITKINVRKVFTLREKYVLKEIDRGTGARKSEVKKHRLRRE